MPWFWEKKSARQGDGIQNEFPDSPNTSVWGPVSQILNWVTSAVSDHQELAQFGDSSPNSVFKNQLFGVGEKEQKSVIGSGWFFISALSNAWEQLKAPWRKVQLRAEEITADNVSQDLLKAELEHTQETKESKEERAVTMGAWFSKLLKKQSISNVHQVKTLTSLPEWIPETRNEGMWNSDEEESNLTEEKEEGETVLATKTEPLVTNKSKGPPGKSQSAQTVRNYILKELDNVFKTNKQKPGERLSQWLLRMWDQGATSLYLTGEELLKLGALSEEAFINQYFSLPNVAAAASLFDWCILAIQYRYPAAVNWEEQMPLWHSIEEAVDQLREMAMKEAIYQQGFAGPDTQCLTDGMNNCLIKGAPSFMHRPLLTLLGSARGISVGEAVVLIGKLEDFQRENASKPPTRAAKEGDNFWKRKSKNGISQRQMFTELLKEGVPKADLSCLPNLKLYEMWKEKCATDRKRHKVKKTISAVASGKQLHRSLPRRNVGGWKMSRPLKATKLVKVPKPGDQRPYLPLTIYWPHRKPQRVMALVDTGSEVTLIYGNPAKHRGETIVINGYGNGKEHTTQVQMKLGLGSSSPIMAKVMISSVHEYIIGIDLLKGREFHIQKGRFAFGV